MKAIQGNETTPARLTTVVNDSVGARSEFTPYDFSASWAREVGVTGGSAGQHPARGPVDPVPLVVKENSASVTASKVIDDVPTSIGEPSEVERCSIVKREAASGGKSKFLDTETFGAVGRVRRDHASSTSGSGVLVKGKHELVAAREVSSNVNQAMVGGNNEGPTIDTGLSSSISTHGSKHLGDEGGMLNVPGKALQATVVTETSVTQQSHGGHGLVTDKPAEGTSQPATDHPSPGMKANEEFSSPTAAKMKREAGNSIAPIGVATSVSSLQTGLANAGGDSAYMHMMQVAPGSAKAGAQVSLVSGGALPQTTLPQTIISTPTRLDVGVFDGSHGWLRVRAELGAACAVHATVTTIDAAHETLRLAVPEIMHYMETESVKVSSIEVHRFANKSGMLDSASSEGQQHGTEQGREHDEAGAQQIRELITAPDQNKIGNHFQHSESIGSVGTSELMNYGGGQSHRASVMPEVMLNAGFTGVGTWFNACA